jgi:uncharacterized flavoprotein (TIGR03862 family)
MSDETSEATRPFVAIVGAGPAGLMAAEVIAGRGHHVVVYDHMPSPARKFLMAGRGGLNLTHSEPLDIFLTRYHAAAPRLAKAIAAFPPEALRAWAEGLGQQTFVGSSGRVFPRAMKASPLLRAWLRRLEALGVSILPRHRWFGWGKAGALRFGTPDGERLVTPAATVLAMGGASWPRLGSDGAWVPLLRGEGIEVAPLLPANCGFELTWSDHLKARHAGAPLKRIALTFAGTTIRGEAMLTEDGLEGGAVYQLGAQLRERLVVEGHATLWLDLRPDVDRDTLLARLNGTSRKESLVNSLRKAAGLSPVAIALLHEVARPLPREPMRLTALIKALPLTVTGWRPLDRAISTAGGVALAEVDEQGMLKALPGVFAAGEMLDWEAPTGGYLLQATFATAVQAAEGVLAWLATQKAAA